MPQAQAGSTGRQALEAHPDPDRARAAMTDEGQHRPQLIASQARTGARARLGRPLIPDEAAALASAADIQTGVLIAQRLVDDGVRQAEIGRATGIANPTVSQRPARSLGFRRSCERALGQPRPGPAGRAWWSKGAASHP